MTNVCGWCSDPRRSDWESRIASGDRIATVAAETPFSESAARRHFRLHVRPELMKSIQLTTAPLQVGDFSSRLLGLADDAAAVRVHAATTGNARLTLQAIKEESAVLVALMQRLGIDTEEAAEDHRTAKVFLTAVVRVMQSGKFPGVAAVIANELEGNGLEPLADRIREAYVADESINERN